MRRTHCSFPRGFLGAALLLLALPAAGQDVALIGVIGDKAAILTLKGGEPKTVKVGQQWNGITVLSVEKERATVEVGGKKRVLLRGQHSSGAAAGADRQSVTLAADPRGHFLAEGAINGHSARFLVDTGASLVAIPASDAVRMRIDYMKGDRGTTQTAGGPVTAYRVRLDTVRLGSIELTGVEAVVIERGLDVVLLGMSFLNRTDMKRDQQTMVLTRRF